MGATRGKGRSNYRLSVVTSRGLKSDETIDAAICNPFDLLLSIGQLCQLTDLGSEISALNDKFKTSVSQYFILKKFNKLFN